MKYNTLNANLTVSVNLGYCCRLYPSILIIIYSCIIYQMFLSQTKFVEIE